jgi:hypothetical protein
MHDVKVEKALASAMIIGARNFPRNELFHPGYVEALESRVPGTGISGILHETKAGICLGGCLDMAKQVFAGHNIVDVARQYKKGMGINAIANQLAYQRERFQVNIGDAVMNFCGDFDNTQKRYAVELYNFLQNPTPGTKKNDPLYNAIIAGVKSGLPVVDAALYALKRHPGMDATFAKQVRRMIKFYSKHIEIQSPRWREFTTIDKTAPLPHAPVKKTTSIGQKAWRILHGINEKSIFNTRKFNKTAQSLGLQVTAGSVIPGAKNDASFLSAIPKQKPGIYIMTFYTGKSQHATLLVNKPDGCYFWDPNYGLFSLDPEKPGGFLYKFINRYYEPCQKLGEHNHGLLLREISEIT